MALSHSVVQTPDARRSGSPVNGRCHGHRGPADLASRGSVPFRAAPDGASICTVSADAIVPKARNRWGSDQPFPLDWKRSEAHRENGQQGNLAERRGYTGNRVFLRSSGSCQQPVRAFRFSRDRHSRRADLGSCWRREFAFSGLAVCAYAKQPFNLAILAARRGGLSSSTRVL